MQLKKSRVENQKPTHRLLYIQSSTKKGRHEETDEAPKIGINTLLLTQH